MQPEFVVTRSVSGGGVGVVRLAGYLSGADWETVEVAIRELSRWNCRRVVLDLSLVHPISCHGVRSLLASIELWRRRGLRLIVSGVRPVCLSVFELMGCSSSVELAGDDDAAEGAAQPRGQSSEGKSPSAHRASAARAPSF